MPLNLHHRFSLSKNQKLTLNNVYWAICGRCVDIIVGLLVGILVARYLGPQNYGLMSYVVSYVTIFSILARFGLDSIEVRELSKKNIATESVLGTAFVLRLSFAIATIFVIFVTLLSFEADRFTRWAVMIYSASLLFSSLGVIRSYFISRMQNRYIVQSEILRKILGAGIKLLLLWFNMPLIWFILALTLDFFLVTSGYVAAYFRRAGSILAWKFDGTVAKMLVKESFPLLLSGAAIIIYQKIDQIMIRNMIDNEAVGQFAIASKLTEYVVFIPTIIAQTVTPLLVKLHRDNVAAFNLKKQYFMDLMFWISCGISLVLSLSAYPIVNALYGAQYINAIPVLQIMAWKAVFVGFLACSGHIIIIENLQRYAVLRNIIGCASSIGLNLVLIPRYGIVGSAWATLATVCIAGYLSHIFIAPYRPLFSLQTSAILTGWKRIAMAGYRRIRLA